MVFVRLALALSLLGGVGVSAAASSADGILSGYSFTSWNDGAGRPLGSVYAIAQTDDGYLWIGAGCRPPPLRRLALFQLGHLSDTPVRGSIKTLAVAKSGGLWIGSADPASVGRIR